jgi:serine/threonine/tyrosine-interacting protein
MNTNQYEKMQTGLSYPHRNADYAYRVPTPPRIVVPPPALTHDAHPDIKLGASKFLPMATDAYANILSSDPVLEWNYERRREAQLVLPYLYLGPMTVAKDEAWMLRESITMVLGVRQKHEFSFKLMDAALSRVHAVGIETKTVDLANNMDLIQAFPHTTEMINSHLSRHHSSTGALGKVLVFCESGNERSAGVVAAYLMETHQDVDYIKAMQLCQAQRFCVNFDDSMKRLLQGYWDILCAKSSVAAEAMKQSQNPDVRSKRGLERQEEDGGDGCMQDDDLERFGGRTFVPFADAPL